MPLYEYICKECGHHFEKMVRFSEANQLPECPECKSRDTQKQISTFATAGASLNLGSSSSSCNTGGHFS